MSEPDASRKSWTLRGNDDQQVDSDRGNQVPSVGDTIQSDQNLISSDDQQSVPLQDNQVSGSEITSQGNPVSFDVQAFSSGDEGGQVSILNRPFLPEGSEPNEGSQDYECFDEELRVPLLYVYPPTLGASKVLHWCTNCNALLPEASQLQEHRTKCLGMASENIVGKGHIIAGFQSASDRDIPVQARSDTPQTQPNWASPDVQSEDSNDQQGASGQYIPVQARSDTPQTQSNSISSDDMSFVLRMVNQVLSSSSNDGSESVISESDSDAQQIQQRPVHPGVLYGCPDCRSKFNNQFDLFRHQEMTHAAVNPNRPFTMHGCPNCRKIFPTYNKLMQHRIQIHKYRP